MEQNSIKFDQISYCISETMRHSFFTKFRVNDESMAQFVVSRQNHWLVENQES